MPAEDTVIVVGAGASLAEAKDRRPKWKTGEWPPLDGNFFQRAAKYRNNPLLRRVLKEATRLGEPDLARPSPAVSLEEHLGRLYFNMNHDPLTTGVYSYFDVVDLYAREIIATTNWMMGKPGLMKKVLQRELRNGNRVSILTFNIDLLLENALAHLTNARPGANWCLKYGYDFATPLSPAGTAGAKELPWDTGAVDIRLYKLHGSLNWVFRHRDYYPPADLVSKERRLWQVTNRELPADRMTLASAKGRPWYLYPVIIPPVYEKHGLIRRYLQEVWEKASAVLLAATRVIFWGYSFPRADMHARHFFQGISQQNPALKSPILINPAPDAATALWSVLHPERVEHHESADSYLSA